MSDVRTRDDEALPDLEVSRDKKGEFIRLTSRMPVSFAWALIVVGTFMVGFSALWTSSLWSPNGQEVPGLFHMISLVFACLGLLPGLLGLAFICGSIVIFCGYKPTRILRYDGKTLYDRYSLGLFHFTKRYMRLFTGLTVRRNPRRNVGNKTSNDSKAGNLSPYLVIDSEDPVPLFKWRSTAPAIALSRSLHEAFVGLGLKLNQLTIPEMYVSEVEDELADDLANLSSTTTLEQDPLASPHERIAIEYQGNAVALKLLPYLGQAGKAMRGFGVVWTVFVGIFTAVAIWGRFSSENTTSNGSSLTPFFILIPFWMVGLGMLAGSYRAARKTEMLILSQEGVQVVVEAPFFRPKPQMSPLHRIQRIRVEASGTTINDVPVPEIHIHRDEGRRLAIGFGWDIEYLEYLEVILTRSLKALKAADQSSEE